MKISFSENERKEIIKILEYQFTYQKERHGHLKLLPKIKENKPLELKDLIRLSKIIKYQIKYIKKITIGNIAITKCKKEINLYKKTLAKIINKMEIEKLIKITNKLEKIKHEK